MSEVLQVLDKYMILNYYLPGMSALFLLIHLPAGCLVWKNKALRGEEF